MSHNPYRDGPPDNEDPRAGLYREEASEAQARAEAYRHTKAVELYRATAEYARIYAILEKSWLGFWRRV